MMESIEKLHELNTFGTVKVDSDLVATKMPMVAATKEEINEIADEIEAEIESRYMLLPCDADGVPIHVGDEVMLDSWSKPRFVFGIARIYWVDEDGTAFHAKNTHHFKTRTVEDVLRDCCNEWNQHCGEDWEQGVYAKYAAELRMRDGDD